MPDPQSDPVARTQGSDASSPPSDDTHAQAFQRLQVGLAGIVAMVLVVGLASVFSDRAQESEEASVPQAAATSEPVEENTQSDPLADAGIVPDLPDETELAEEALLQEQAAELEAQADGQDGEEGQGESDEAEAGAQP